MRAGARCSARATYGLPLALPRRDPARTRRPPGATDLRAPRRSPRRRRRPSPPSSGLRRRRRRSRRPFRMGDDVVHAAFGEGVVTGVEPGGDRRPLRRRRHGAQADGRLRADREALARWPTCWCSVAAGSSVRPGMSALLSGLEEGGFDARGCRAYVWTLGRAPSSRHRSSPASIPAPAWARCPSRRLSALPRVQEAGAPWWHAVGGRLAAAGLAATRPAGALIGRAALSRDLLGRRSLDVLRHEIEKLGIVWDGRLRVAVVEVDSGRRVWCWGSSGAPGRPGSRSPSRRRARSPETPGLLGRLGTPTSTAAHGAPPTWMPRRRDATTPCSRPDPTGDAGGVTRRGWRPRRSRRAFFARIIITEGKGRPRRRNCRPDRRHARQPLDAGRRDAVIETCGGRGVTGSAASAQRLDRSTRPADVASTGGGSQRLPLRARPVRQSKAANRCWPLSRPHYPLCRLAYLILHTAVFASACTSPPDGVCGINHLAPNSGNARRRASASMPAWMRSAPRRTSRRRRRRRRPLGVGVELDRRLEGGADLRRQRDLGQHRGETPHGALQRDREQLQPRDLVQPQRAARGAGRCEHRHRVGAADGCDRDDRHAGADRQPHEALAAGEDRLVASRPRAQRVDLAARPERDVVARPRAPRPSVGRAGSTPILRK